MQKNKIVVELLLFFRKMSMLRCEKQRTCIIATSVKMQYVEKDYKVNKLILGKYRTLIPYVKSVMFQVWL